jgi:uncharacterized protein YdeI (YjbR/CyaY-like superfamily)
MVERDIHFFETAEAWEQWLEANSTVSTGIALKLAKKSSGIPSPTHPEALDVALCFGWIDGVRNTLDDNFYLQTFMPRTKRSTWSQVNRDKVDALIAAGRMRAGGQAEIDRAKADGRWDAAYAPQSTIEVPDDLAAALAASPAAAAVFARLSSQNRFAILFRVHQPKRPETRARRITQFVEQLERGETIYPQKLD